MRVRMYVRACMYAGAKYTTNFSKSQGKMVKILYGQKLGDSVLQDEFGGLITLYPDTFYERNKFGYWLVRKIGCWWKIEMVRFVEEKEIEES